MATPVKLESSHPLGDRIHLRHYDQIPYGAGRTRLRMITPSGYGTLDEETANETGTQRLACVDLEDRTQIRKLVVDACFWIPDALEVGQPIGNYVVLDHRILARMIHGNWTWMPIVLMLNYETMRVKWMLHRYDLEEFIQINPLAQKAKGNNIWPDDSPLMDVAEPPVVKKAVRKA